MHMSLARKISSSASVRHPVGVALRTFSPSDLVSAVPISSMASTPSRNLQISTKLLYTQAKDIHKASHAPGLRNQQGSCGSVRSTVIRRNGPTSIVQRMRPHSVSAAAEAMSDGSGLVTADWLHDRYSFSSV